MNKTLIEKKIGFVTPWFGMDIPGGAEAELRGLVLHLAESGQDLEILSTCVKNFNSDWNENFHKPGMTIENGIKVRRFEVRERDTQSFDRVNYKLMMNQLPLTEEEENIYVEEMVNSPALYEYMETHKEEYALFVFIPYMFGTTYFGMQVAPEKSILIPCLHDESYIHLNKFRELFSHIAGMIFHAKPEAELAEKVYDLSTVTTAVLGEGVDTDLSGNPERFRQKYRISDPFVLYAGRKDAGKNVDTLIRYFCEYKKWTQTELKLVLIGGGEIEIPEEYRTEILDLGFVPKQDKYDAYSAAMLLCQPSHNESFSLVIMESWLSRRPVLVSDACAVTKNFVKESNGGLYFKDFFEFKECLDYVRLHNKEANQMGEQGRNYVMHMFAWNVIVEKYLDFFGTVVKK